MVKRLVKFVAHRHKHLGSALPAASFVTSQTLLTKLKDVDMGISKKAVLVRKTLDVVHQERDRSDQVFLNSWHLAVREGLSNLL